MIVDDYNIFMNEFEQYCIGRTGGCGTAVNEVK